VRRVNQQPVYQESRFLNQEPGLEWMSVGVSLRSIDAGSGESLRDLQT